MNMYLITAILVLMVIRQIGDHSFSLRPLALPVLGVAAAVMFLHCKSVGGNDITPELPGVLADAAMAVAGGLTIRLRRGADRRTIGRADWPGASISVTGVPTAA